MDATMERDAACRSLGFGKAFAEQFRLLWTSRRPMLMIIALLGVLALSGDPWVDTPLARLFSLWPLWLVVAGPLWAFAVWHGEGPSNRLYFWAHPVSRTAHSMSRVAAGAAWLVIMYAILISAGLLFAGFEGELNQMTHVSFTGWLSFFTGPLLGYLAVSALTVPSDYPIRWFLAILFGIPLTLSILDEWVGMQDVVETVLKPLVSEHWGFGMALLAPFVLTMERIHNSVYDRGGSTVADEISLTDWWIAMPLWLLFWIGVVFLLARRHPDVFPRWRRSA